MAAPRGHARGGRRRVASAARAAGRTRAPGARRANESRRSGAHAFSTLIVGRASVQERPHRFWPGNPSSTAQSGRRVMHSKSAEPFLADYVATSCRRRRVTTARAIKRSTIPTAPTMFVTTAIAPATSLVSAQIRPIIVPTTSTATIAASQYKIRRLVMSPSLLSWGHFANRTAHRFTGHRGSSELIDPGHRFSPLLLQLVAGDDERE